MKFDLSNKSLPRGFAEPHTLSGMPADTPLLVAFSGGADSRALLHLLAEAAQRDRFPLYLAHVNHGIRGEESDRDQRLCRPEAHPGSQGRRQLCDY